jgi:hypothetical protein
VVPARHVREVIIRKNNNQPAELAKRTVPEIVQSINTALKTNGAVAARRLQSGDTVVTFKDKASQYTRDTTWVQTAFGEGATLSSRTVTVLVKRIPADLLRGRTWDEATKALQGDNKEAGILRVGGRMPREG